MKKDTFAYWVTWSEDDDEYAGLCAEFPSLSWLAKTPESALKGIRKVVDDVMRDMHRKGEARISQGQEFLRVRSLILMFWKFVVGEGVTPKKDMGTYKKLPFQDTTPNVPLTGWRIRSWLMTLTQKHGLLMMEKS